MDGRAWSSGKNRHPLAKAQRPQVTVDEATLERWKHDALDDVGAVLLDQESWLYGFDEYIQQHAYKVLLDKPNIRGGGRVRRQTVDFLCRVQLDLTLEDVALAMHNVSNLEQRLAFAQIYQGIVLDGAIIELYDQETEEDPFHSVSIKWLAFDSPTRQILSYRDFLYFEYCFTTQDALGRRVLVDYRKSVDLHPDQLRDHGLDIMRSSTFTLTTYRMEGSNVISNVRGVHEPNGSVHSWVSMNYLPVVFTRFLNLKGLPHSKALLRVGVRASVLAKRYSNAALDCHSCRRKFGLTTRKARCRACSRTVCRRCTCKLILPVDGDQIASALPFVRIQFCRGCIAFAHSQTMTDSHASSLRPTSSSEISCVSTDSFFGASDDRHSALIDLHSVRTESTGTAMLSATRLERMLARLSLDSDQPEDSSTDVDSDSPCSSDPPIFADDGMRVFFPSARSRDSRSHV